MFDRGSDLREIHSEPPGQNTRVPRPERGIADIGDDRGGGPKSAGPPFHRLEIEGREPLIDHELEHRLLRIEKGPHRSVAAGEPQIAGIEALGRDGDIGLGREPLLVAESSEGRLLARRIRIEREDDLAGRGVVAHDPAQHRDVLGAECRSAGRDRRRHPREVTGHDVCVALDDHDAPLPRDVTLGQIQAVEHLCLLVDRRLGAVEVLRALVVLVEAARAETDDLAGHVADRPHEPASEAVVHPALPLGEEPRRRQLLAREAAGDERIHRARPALGGVADAEVRRRGRIEAAIAEEAPRGIGLGGQQLRLEPLRGSRARRVEPRPPGRLRNGTTVLVVQRVADASREPLDRLGERQVVDALQEGVHVADSPHPKQW